MTSKELRQARSVIITVLVAVFLLFLMAQSRAGEVYSYAIDGQGREYHGITVDPDRPPFVWAEAVPIYHNPNRAPEGVDHDYAFAYAAWSWSQRTGHDVYYAGETDQTEMLGAIVINWSSYWDFLAMGYPDAGGLARLANWTGTNEIHHAKVWMRFDQWTHPDSRCYNTIVAHEIGHAMGIRIHSASDHDVMHNPGICRYSLTAADIEMTAYDGGDRCFVELTPDMDLFVPEIGAQQASLNYDGLGWDLGIYSTSSGAGCNTVTVDATGDIYMNDVRSMDMSLNQVELETVGNDRWVLRYAQ